MLAVATLTLPVALGAQAPTPQELARLTPAGSYLAARHANAERDAAAAAAYYRAALKSDPKNGELLERTFFSLIAEGDIDDAVKLAERIIQVDHNDRSARLLLGVRAIKLKQYQTARQQLTQSIRGPITDLTATLLAAWAMAGANDTRAAIETIDRLSGPDWYAIFKDMHAGLILDLAGNKKEAGRRFERAYKLDATALRLVQAYGSWASRNAGKQEAEKIYKAFDTVLPRHPLIVEAQNKVQHGERVPPLVTNPQAGAAEVLYGLGASLGRRGGEDLGIMYLQLALYLAPQHPMALLSLADLYESMKKPELAIKVYERVPPDSPLRRNANIQLALNLDSLDKPDEAEKHLQTLISEHPDDLEAIMALGNILRARKHFSECADVYSKAIAVDSKPEKSDWTIYYFRGICYERSKQWPKAEADLKKALELYPDQPHVLNYLGYSWIDQGINLEEGMRMIRRAVEQRPDDGYIVDSLGWAYFRTGDYDNAVKQLDRAVELKPEDPTINDHLGDAYWKVGRQLEAKFQWSHARDLKPEPDELAKIEQKLKFGLTEETSSSADAEKAKKPGNGG
ncbi:MAG TPA: tetratricopeptide repeat protein [Xanthobacteraceae bacterium]|nr:tetratricopeptide repeat protein [Xanthobacteraceae bacterium]